MESSGGELIVTRRVVLNWRPRAINATNLGCSITCKGLAASIRFYRDAISFAVAQTYENQGKVVAAVVAAGDCRIVLNQDDGQLG